MILGDDVRDARERLHLTRPLCVDLLGGQLTVSALARIEAKGPKTETETDIVRELFTRAGYTPRDERVIEPEVIAAPILSSSPSVASAWVKVRAFRTIAHHDIIKYRGERYRFLALVTSPTGEVYIEAANLHNGGVHSLRPELVRDRKGRALPEEVSA